MSKPITITVPDDLHERLQPFKEKMNVSQVCQAALDEKVKDWERKLEAIHGDPDMEEILARLRKEKAEVENEWRGKGVKAGLKMAKRASYEGLKFMATKIKTENEIKTGENFDVEKLDEREFHLYFQTYGEYLEAPDQYFDDEESGGENLTPPEEEGPDFWAWEDGFFESVRRFWDEVKDIL